MKVSTRSLDRSRSAAAAAPLSTLGAVRAQTAIDSGSTSHLQPRARVTRLLPEAARFHDPITSELPVRTDHDPQPQPEDTRALFLANGAMYHNQKQCRFLTSDCRDV